MKFVSTSEIFLFGALFLKNIEHVTAPAYLKLSSLFFTVMVLNLSAGFQHAPHSLTAGMLRVL
jgi:hypothetical protein